MPLTQCNVRTLQKFACGMDKENKTKKFINQSTNQMAFIKVAKNE